MPIETHKKEWPRMKKIISVLLLITLVFGAVPGISFSASAAETESEKSLSEQLAELWGFFIEPDELSKKRDELGLNPLMAPNAETGQNGVYGVVPLELAVIDGYFDSPGSSSLSHCSLFDGKHDYVNYYEVTAFPNGTSSSPGAVTLKGAVTKDAVTKEEVNYTSTTFQTGGGLGYPRAAIAADLNGDGIDEVVQCHLDLEGLTPAQAQTQNPAPREDNASPIMAFYVTVGRAGQTGIKYEDYVKLCDYSYEPGERFIPENILEWSSFIQMVSGDFNGDGKDEIAVSCGPEGIFVVTGGSTVYKPSVQKLDTSFLYTYRSPSRQSAFYLAAGDVDHDGTDDLAATFMADIFFDTDAADLLIWKWDKAQGKYVNKYSGNIRLPAQLSNCSVTIADINYDKQNEIVVGGFNTNKGSREMTLAYCKYDNSWNTLGTFMGATRVWDDEGTATVNHGYGDNEDTRSRENVSNARHYGHSWNWTIPLSRVCLTGRDDGARYDQIFFGNGLYYYDIKADQFAVYDDVSPDLSSRENRAASMDNYAHPYQRGDLDANNASIIAMIPGTFIKPETNQLMSEREQLLVYYVKDNKGSDDKNGYLTFEIAILHQPQSVGKQDVQVSKKYLAQNKWGRTDFYPLVCAPNIDDDAYLAQYIGKVTALSDPVITAVLQAVPYFSDIPQYTDNSFRPGRTELEKSSGRQEGTAGQLEISAGAVMEFKVPVVAETEFEILGTSNTEWEDTTTVTQAIGYYNESLDDAVVLQATPYDIYCYMMFIPPADRIGAAPETFDGYPEWWVPVTVMMPGYTTTKTYSVQIYNELAKRHNEIAEAYNAQNPGAPVALFTPLTYGQEASDIFGYRKGDPASYPTKVSDFRRVKPNEKIKDGSLKAFPKTADTPMSVDSVGDGLGQQSSIAYETNDWQKTMGGLSVHANMKVGGLWSKAGVSVEASGLGGTINADLRGAVYSSEIENYPDSVKDYKLTTTLNVYMFDIGGAAFEDGVPVIAYTVQEAKGRPKLPDKIRVLADSATANSVTISYDIPAVISMDLIPDSYRLEIRNNFTKEWELVADSNNREKPLPVSREQTNVFTVTGLESGLEHNFRISAAKVGKTTSTHEFTARTKATGAPPVIEAQPKSTVTSVHKSAEFSVSASLPQGVKSDSTLYYIWYYEEKADGDLKWVKLEDVMTAQASNGKGTVTKGSLAGAEITGNADKTLKLENVPLSAHKINFGCQVSYMILDTAISANTTKATLNVSAEELKQFNVSYSAEDNGTLKAVSGEREIASGSKLTQYYPLEFIAEPKDGYVVKKWRVNGADQQTKGNTYTIERAETNYDVSVTFETAKVSIMYAAEPVGAGTVSASSAGTELLPGDSVTAGSAITFRAAPADGGVFLGWLIKNNETGEYQSVPNEDGSIYTKPDYTVKASEPIDVKAVFGKKINSTVKFTVSDNTPANGRSKLKIGIPGGEEIVLANGETASVPANTPVTFTAEAETGARVGGWTFTPVSGTALKPITKGEVESVSLENVGGGYDVRAQFISVRECEISWNYGGELEALVAGAKIKNGDMVRYGSDVTFKAYSPERKPAYLWSVNNIILEAPEGVLTILGISADTKVQPVFAESLTDSKIKRELADYFKNADSHWAKAALQSLADKGAFDNWLRQNMEPNDYLTRATFAVMLKWLSNESYDGDFSFDDINASDWFTNSVSWAASNGYMVGSGSGEFKPNEPITKEQLVVALYRYISAKGFYLAPVQNPAEIRDIDSVSSWAQEAVYYFISAGLIQGDSSGRFNSRSNVTIAEFCTVLESLSRKINQPAQYPEPFAEEAPSEAAVTPSAEPEMPVNEPVIPAAEPEIPAEEPQQPMTEPETHAVEPDTPATEPEAPAAESASPAAEPPAPATA